MLYIVKIRLVSVAGGFGPAAFNVQRIIRFLRQFFSVHLKYSTWQDSALYHIVLGSVIVIHFRFIVLASSHFYGATVTLLLSYCFKYRLLLPSILTQRTSFVICFYSLFICSVLLNRSICIGIISFDRTHYDVMNHAM